MAVEKLRIESAGFDITLVPDDEDSALTGTPTLKLKKPLPHGLRAKDFIGKIVTVAESDQFTSVGGITMNTFGVINTVLEMRTFIRGAVTVGVYCSVTIGTGIDGGESINSFIVYMDYPAMNRCETLVTIPKSMESRVAMNEPITLTKTETSGKYNYTGSGTIDSSDYMSLVQFGAISLKVDNKTYYAGVASAIPESNNTKITLTSYVGYSPDKVSDVNITIGKKSNGSYPVSVSFVVDPA